MHLLAVGLNHTTAPVSLREKVAFPADQLGQAVASACAWFDNSGKRPQAQEAAILSTCNRTEIYGASANDGNIEAALDATAKVSKSTSIVRSLGAGLSPRCSSSHGSGIGPPNP